MQSLESGPGELVTSTQRRVLGLGLGRGMVFSPAVAGVAKIL